MLSLVHQLPSKIWDKWEKFIEYILSSFLQLLALQSKLNSTMKAHYEHRGANSRRDLARFKNHICKTQHKIADLETQFKLVISNVDSFWRAIHRNKMRLQQDIIIKKRFKKKIFKMQRIKSQYISCWETRWE